MHLVGACASLSLSGCGSKPTPTPEPTPPPLGKTVCTSAGRDQGAFAVMAKLTNEAGQIIKSDEKAAIYISRDGNGTEGGKRDLTFEALRYTAPLAPNPEGYTTWAVCVGSYLENDFRKVLAQMNKENGLPIQELICVLPRSGQGLQSIARELVDKKPTGRTYDAISSNGKKGFLRDAIAGRDIFPVFPHKRVCIYKYIDEFRDDFPGAGTNPQRPTPTAQKR